MSMAVAAAMMLTVVPVGAAGTNYGATIGGTKTTTFDKFLVMDFQANVPNATFSYAVQQVQQKHMTYRVRNSRF